MIACVPNESNHFEDGIAPYRPVKNKRISAVKDLSSNSLDEGNNAPDWLDGINDQDLSAETNSVRIYSRLL